LKGIWSGRGAVAPAAPSPAPLPPAPRPEPVSRVSVPAVQQTTLEAAFDAAGADAVAGAPPGEPSHPAQDHISLDSVFGDDSRRSVVAPGPGAAPQSGAGGGGGGGGGFSFDDFFGGAAPGGAAGGTAAPAPGGAPVADPSPRTPSRSSGRAQRPPEDEAEADQFQQWLKKLKS